METDNLQQNTQIRLLRLKQIIGDPHANPPIPAILPIQRSTFYSWIEQDIIPKGVKIGKRASFWRQEDIYKVINEKFPNKVDPGTASD